jgi:hypothetical protein
MNERNKVPYHTTLLYKSAIASFLNSAYNIHVAGNLDQKLVVRNFKKRNCKIPSKRAILDAVVFLIFYRTPTLFYKEYKAHYHFLQTKAIALIMFFCLTRIQETALIHVDRMIENAKVL